MKRVSLKDKGAVFGPGDGSPLHTGPKFKTGKARTASETPAPVRNSDDTFTTLERALNHLSARHGACQGNWTYNDSRGQPLMVVARFPAPNDPDKPCKKPKKTFRPIARAGDRWRIGDPVGKLPLYNLPGIAAAKPHEVIYIVEGEKKADLLVSMGLVATTSSHGCESAHRSDWAPVAGRDIVIIPDHDAGGETYAVEVAKLVGDIDSCNIKIIKLSDLWAEIPDAGDVIDLLAARDGDKGRVQAEILALAERTAPITDGLVFRPIGAVDLIHEYPDLRPAVIEGLLRQGEVMNVVAAPKVGKSWIVLALAFATATGTSWLGMATCRGKVLILDAELHRETLARRLHSTRKTLGVQEEDILDLEVVPLRGQRADIETLANRLSRIAFGKYRIIIFDALYRFMPPEGEENSNETMTRVYNTLDLIAKKTNAAIVVVHHASKGNQSDKSVTDVGSGAGSQSRAADSHLILRPHEQDGAVVVDAVVRSFPPLDPFVIENTSPGWRLAPHLDPAQLKKPSRRGQSDRQRSSAKEVAKPREWSPEDFASQFVGRKLRIKEEVLSEAKAEGISKSQAEALFKRAIAAGVVHRHQDSASSPHRFSTDPPLLPGVGGGWPSAPTTPGAMAPGGCGGDALPPSPPSPDRRRSRPFEEEHEANDI